MENQDIYWKPVKDGGSIVSIVLEIQKREDDEIPYYSWDKDKRLRRHRRLCISTQVNEILAQKNR